MKFHMNAKRETEKINVHTPKNPRNNKQIAKRKRRMQTDMREKKK